MNAFFLKIATLSISASFLVLAVLLLRLVLKKAPKWISVLLWGLVALRLLMPFSIESNFSLVPDSLADGQIITNVGNVYIGETDTIGIYEGHEPQAGQPPVGSFVAQEDSIKPAKTVANTVYPFLSWIWLAGVSLMLLYTVISYILLRRKVNTAVQLRKGILQSENVASPFVLGIIRPKIYLPFRMDDQTLEYVIAHEQSHIRRKDHWWKPFGFILLAIHWFNPLMWLSYILLCRDIELACDEKVIKQMDNENRANYTEALVVCSVNRRRIAACPLAFGEVGVKERVKSVMNYKKPAFWIIIVAVLTCVIAAVCFLTNPKASANNEKMAPDDAQSLSDIGGADAPSNVTTTKAMTLDDVVALSRKGMDPTWEDFKNFTGRDVGSGLFVMRYDIDDDFYVLVGDGKLTGTPMYAVLCCTCNDASVDIRGGDVQEFIERYATFEGDDFDPVETVVGNRKIYYKSADDTWRTNGHTYQYRLEITGRMPDAAVDSTFVYLSNLETISFEQAWRAAGLSSNSTDYFSPEEAVLVDWRTGDHGANAVDDNNNFIIKTDKLNGAITEAILRQHKSEKPDGLLSTESHIILVNEVVSGTPLVGQTNHVREVTVYVYYLNMRFHVQGDRPEEHDGIYGQAAITFTVDKDGIYNLKHFVKPESSVDSGAEYSAELKNKFVAASEDIAENEEKYGKQLLDSCWKNATEYMEHLKAQASAQPGGTTTETVCPSDYVSYEYAAQLYHSLTASIDSMTEAERFSALAEIFDNIAQGHPLEQHKFAQLTREIINNDDLVFEDEEVFDLARDYDAVFSWLANGDRDWGVQGLNVKTLSETTAQLGFSYWGEMRYSVKMVQVGEPWVTGEFTAPYKGELGQYLMTVQFHDAEPSTKFMEQYSARTDHKLHITHSGSNHEMTMRIIGNADHGYNVYIGSDDPFWVKEQSPVMLNRLIGTFSVQLNFTPVNDCQLTVTGQSLAQGKYMAFFDTTPRYVLLPLTAIMRQLGADIQWSSDRVAQIRWNGKDYMLNTSEVSLLEDGNDRNLIIPTPGGKMHTQAIDRELLLDHLSVKTVMLMLGTQIKIDVDHLHQSVVIDYL